MTTEADHNFKDPKTPLWKRLRKGFIVWLVLTIACLLFFEVPYELWACRTLTKNAQQGTALIYGELGHGVVKYRYFAYGHEHTGKGRRNTDEEKYRHVKVGQDSIVYYSASHPEISALQTPHGTAEVIFSGFLFPMVFGVVILISCVFDVGKTSGRKDAAVEQKSSS